MRNFNWEAIPKDNVLGKHNIWTAEKKDFDLDTKHMEELFSHNNQKQVQATNRRSIRQSPSNATGPEVVSILNAKKNMNIGIFLKQFRRSVNEMIEDLTNGKGEGFGSGKLKEMCKLLPDDGEVRQLLDFKGDCSTLSEADRFMVQLVRVPCYEERLNCLVLKEEFPHYMDEVNDSIAIMTAAGRELLECIDLHSVIRLVLKTGNYMNSGGYAGSAVGFRMTSLLKLADTKANKPGMNLMHYVVMQAQNIDASLLKFPEQLGHIGDAARIHKQEIEADFQKEVSKVQVSKQNAGKQPDLEEQMRDFLQDVDTRIKEAEASFKNLAAVSDSVAEYFCEDPSQFKLEECCSIFSSFCEKFKRAIQENLEREVVEVKRRQRERTHCATKRRSTATCSTKDMEGVALESVLQGFLNNRGSRRRAGTASPARTSLAEITSQENCSTDNKEVKRNNWTKPFFQSPLATENINKREDETPKQPEIRSFGRLWKRDGASRVSVTMEQDEENCQTEEEVQNMREVSRKVLRYQSSRGSISSSEALSPVQSPRKTVFQEDKQLLIMAIEENTSQSTLSSMPLLQNQNIGRRHTIAFSEASCGNISMEDIFVPCKVNGSPAPPIGSIGKMKSVDCNMLITQTVEDSIAKLLHSQEEYASSQLDDSSQLQTAEISQSQSADKTHLSQSADIETKTEDWPGNGKRLNNQSTSPKNTKESFSFLSFFKRWRDKDKSISRELTEVGSDSVDP